MAPTPEQARRLKTARLSGKHGSKSSKKQPNARVQRYLKSTEPQLVERFKGSLLMKGIQCSQNMALVLKELRALQAPHAKLLSKKNQIAPFEDASSLEFLATKNDCALFAMASTNKKRPNNLVMGRTFDHSILDMCEFGVLRFKSCLAGQDYPGTVPKKRIGSKPMLLFCGDLWQQKAMTGTTTGQVDYPSLQNLLIDFYRGDVVDKLVPTGLDHVICFTLAAAPSSSNNNTPTVLLHQRTYFCQLKKDPHNAASNTPVPWLENCGPDLDLVIRRTQWASPDLAVAARKVPESIHKAARKKKNQSTTLFGETVGRLHMSKQDLEHMGGRKVKALRRHEKMEKQAEQQAIEQDLEHEMQS
eukprot:CAMPEP_0172455108 /NCGR_PEP_ID=MMETSP1065-20121228/11898_1 /TAXON_ID=265537 /ORGANISM="Amphiprora paludosa, Strain CCMP125" /LENGTH=358 /DNA_ID=CAMNT_0013207563 /DNA_START=28 /DNA_END=1104 /DNA_ORIENTATION=+